MENVKPIQDKNVKAHEICNCHHSNHIKLINNEEISLRYSMFLIPIHYLEYQSRAEFIILFVDVQPTDHNVTG